MKHFLFFILLCAFTSTYGSHIEGRIGLQYIGGTTGNTYQIRLTLFGDIASTSGLPASSTAKVSSSCQTLITVALALDTSASFIPSMYECAYVNSPNNSLTEMAQYVGYVEMPACIDWVITHENCCRGGGYTSNTTESFFPTYLRIELNNQKKHHSVAELQDSWHKLFCINREVVWNRRYIDSDGDSINITPHTVYKGESNGLVPVNLGSGYSVSNPLKADASIGFAVDAQTGNLRFKPTELGRYLVGFKIDEYHFDSLQFIYEKIATHFDETIITVVANCVDSTWISMGAGDTMLIPCGTRDFELELPNPFYTNSLHTSDFVLYAPSGPPVPILSAEAVQPTLGKSTKIAFTLYDSITTNGVYALKLQTGFDGNSLVMPCGVNYILSEFVYFEVTNCSSIGQQEVGLTKVSLYPNPAKDFLRIDFASDRLAELKIFDALGKLVLLKDRYASNQMLDHNLPVGIYVAKIKINKEVFIAKFVIQN